MSPRDRRRERSSNAVVDSWISNSIQSCLVCNLILLLPFLQVLQYLIVFTFQSGLEFDPHHLYTLKSPSLLLYCLFRLVCNSAASIAASRFLFPFTLNIFCCFQFFRCFFYAGISSAILLFTSFFFFSDFGLN